MRELEMVGRAPTSPPDVAASRAAVTNPKNKSNLGVGKRLLLNSQFALDLFPVE